MGLCGCPVEVFENMQCESLKDGPKSSHDGIF